MNPQNPVGTNGFAFVEFTTPAPDILKKQFSDLGFAEIGQHKEKAISLFRQNQIYFFINQETTGRAVQFSNQHGASAMGMGWYVANPNAALEHACNHGAIQTEKNDYTFPAIDGVGGSIIYFVHSETDFLNQFHIHNAHPVPGFDLDVIDHLTHNLHRGNMNKMAAFYEQIFNFKEIRYFDIRGKLTGLVSRALTSPCGKIRIPLNESADEKSQIEEFIREFHGEGIQHIALSTADIYKSVSNLKHHHIQFLDTPDTYYELIEKRLPHHGEPIDALKQLRILIDGKSNETERKLLLQIFTQNMLGPVFFEIIQRKGDEGFGEGNFQALFESIELDQIRRGALTQQE